MSNLYVEDGVVIIEFDADNFNIKIKDRDLDCMFESDDADRFKGEINKYLLKRNINFKDCKFHRRYRIYRNLIRSCNRCVLHKQCNSPVPADICLTPKAVIIGRSPGITDDRHNKVFYSLSNYGKILIKYLNILNINRQEVFIGNVVNCYSVSDKKLEKDNIYKCIRWKSLEFDLFFNPKFFFLLGKDALRLMMGESFPSIVDIYGSIYRSEFRGKEVYIIPLMHPGFLIHNKSWVKSTALILKYVKNNIWGV